MSLMLPFIADGVCPTCYSPFSLIALRDADKLQNLKCVKCLQPLNAVYRILDVADQPMRCMECGRDPVFIEKGVASAMFHYDYKQQKVVRHMCDLEKHAAGMKSLELESKEKVHFNEYGQCDGVENENGEAH